MGKLAAGGDVHIYQLLASQMSRQHGSKGKMKSLETPEKSGFCYRVVAPSTEEIPGSMTLMLFKV